MKVDGKPLLKDIEECADSKFNIGLLDLFCVFTHVSSIYANLLEQKKAFT